MNRLTVALSCLSFAVVACNSGSGTPTLTSLTSVSSDAKCPAGGVTVNTGPDKNGNGKLDANEINQTQEICNGSNGQPGMNGMNGMNGNNGQPGADGGPGATSLVATTPLPAGDTHCPTGGTQLDFGLDNGAGGGTADDGVLQPGEILHTSYVCNGSLPYYPDDITPPASPAGQFSINASGGDGLNGPGGNSNGVQIYLNPGSLGGGVKVFNTGKVDASFTLPAAPAFVGGANPLAVTTSMTVHGYPTIADGIESGDTYFRSDADSRLYQDVGGNAVEVTGLSVAAGQTLTFDIDTKQSVINISVRHDIHNAGTIQIGTLADGVTGVSTSFGASNYYGDTGSSIITKGLSGTVSTDGGTNGAVGGGGPLEIDTGGLLINQGSIDTSGGDGASGGQGGAVYLYSNSGALYNTGAITTHGGTGAVGNGGLGGQINLEAFLGVYNSHQLDGYGGAGVTAGGNSQGIFFSTDGAGLIKNGGALNTYGGACTGVDCGGGTGGDISLTSRGGDLFNDASLQAYGGDGIGRGGGGGGLNLLADEGSAPTPGNVHLAAGSVHVDGNLSTKGGKGNPGGGGNSISIFSRPYSVPLGQKVELFGYLTIDANGGPGDNAFGGNAGYVNLYTSTSFPPYGEGSGGAPSGPVINYAKVSSRGGDGTQGGSAGGVSVITQLSYDFRQPAEQALNFGDIDVSTGASSSFNANYNGGNIQVEGISGAENHGALKSHGGTTSGGPITASGGGQVTVACDSGPAKNTGAVDVSGGGSSGNGGAGGNVTFYGTLFNNSGAVTANGGNATNTGGSGGEIDITSSQGASTNTGTFSVTGGTGTPAGTKGYVYLDGVDATP